jgi:hypothetical protein
VPSPTGNESPPPNGTTIPRIGIGTEFIGADKPFIVEKRSGLLFLSEKTILEKRDGSFRDMDVLRVVAKAMPSP